jgi:RNA polymerase sigma factor (sigma-70 family)
MSPAPTSIHRLLDEPLVARAFKRSNAPRWGLSRASFTLALERSVASRFATEVRTPALVAEYVDSLNLEELALACACAEGHASAWSYFIDCYRPGLRAAARAIAGDGAGPELADSIYGELYGLEERDGRRRSLFDYFHGRSRLSTWLRSILAQRNVDRVRLARRFEPFDETQDDDPRRPAPAGDAPDAERARFARLAQQALSTVIRRLAAPDRLRLAAYYLQQLTLAQIGRLVGEHEATVSRKLDRLRRQLRADVERSLRDEHGLGDEQIRACFAYALDDAGLDLDRVLGPDGQAAPARQEKAGGSF